MSIKLMFRSFAVEVPAQYSTILTKGKASVLKKNNVIAQTSLTGLVNTVFQVVQVGLVLIL